MRRLSRLLSSLPVLAISAGCGSSNGGSNQPPIDPVTGSPIFESDTPNPQMLGGSKGGGDLAAAPTANGDPGMADSSGEAARAIEEADIIKMEGQRLYALSQYGGLNVVDVSQRDQLRLLGRKKIQAAPFEMYVRDSIALALYNGYGEYVHGDTADSWLWTSSAYVVALDTRDPSDIKEIGRFEIPGQISDSRIVGNVLYAVGFESGYCWHCDNGQRTTILSLNVTNPTSISKIDQLSFVEKDSSWRRSISVTDQRMYVAGPEYSDANGQAENSTIQVVDISDPSGRLRAGASVEAHGAIQSRWQMDEIDGVLRVVSQKGDWRPQGSPQIQTFQVRSADDIQPLGEASMTVPSGEDLRSVRFDGPRAYAVTALQTDPLFTIDLSNPAAPRQLGAIEIPGWIYYMEPRDNRLLGLGYEQGNAAGALAVSLFDVSDLGSPKLLDRVNFGGDWSWISEDQDRVHKAFKVLDEANLILMPFAGWSQGAAGNGCGGSYETGVQLIDWRDDQLKLAGVAPAFGQARRGFVYDERLFAVSDERVETFDISDRQSPKKTASLPLSHWVARTVPIGDNVIRVAQNWWTNVTELDVTPLSNVTSTEQVGKLELSDVPQDRCYGGSWLRDVVGAGDRAYVFYNRYDYSGNTTKSSTRVLTVSIADPTQPRVIGDALLDFAADYWSYQGVPGLYDPGRSLVASGNVVALLSGQPQYDGAGSYKGTNASLRIIDLSDPNQPRVETHAIDGAQNTSGLLIDGDQLVYGRSVISPTDPSRSRFYLDRYQIGSAGAVTALPSINVPGAVQAYDAARQRLFTVDFQRVERDDLTAEQCYTTYATATFVYQVGSRDATAPGNCTGYLHRLRLVALEGNAARILGTSELAPNEAVSTAALGDDRLFVSLRPGGYFYGIASGGAAADVPIGGGILPGGVTSVTERPFPMLVASGLATGTLQTGRISLGAGDYWGQQIAATGKRAVLFTGWRGKLSVLDASDAQSPRLVREAEVLGYVQDLRTAGGVGIASLGADGVQVISLEDE